MPKSDQGSTQGRYQVIPRCLIFIGDGNKVLLLKGSQQKRLWANRYNGIGGHIERGEDVLSAARRELFEESGLVVPDLRLVGTAMVDVDPSAGVAIFIFRGSYSGGDLAESHEGALEWVNLSTLAGYPLVEDLYQIVPQVFSSGAGDAPFSARYYYDEKDQMQVAFA